MIRLTSILTLVGCVTVATGCGSESSASAGAKACVALTSCGIVATNLTSCTYSVHTLGLDYIANAIHASQAQATCVANAGADCDAVRKCLNNGAAPASCNGGRSCEGNTIVLCENNLAGPNMMGQRRYDCSNGGLQCIANGATIECGSASCSGLNASCNGTKLDYCPGNGVETQLDCSNFSGTCNTATVAHCRGTGATCSQTSINPFDPPRIRCQGKQVVFCLDGQEGFLDCGRFGLGCFPNINGHDFDCGVGGECDTNYNATCANDGTLTYCNAGKVDTFNCKGQGYTSCSPDGGGRCVK